jgi:DNA-binding winged helix-turn-helix (wHTH) protein
VPPSGIVRFGDFEADPRTGPLRKRGVRIKLGEQSFEILAVLLERGGEVVSREDLRRRLWPQDVFVDFENNLNTLMARLREALGDPADHPRFIETLPKRGYRFIASLAEQRAVRPRLLVLPFVNLSGDPSQEYLSYAIT